MENIFESNQDIQAVDIEESIKNSYLDYSMSVIVGRALPDARDGLKPVHRRILYSMHNLGVTSRGSHVKSARIVGDVIGKYHPHGDTAVYDALVRMAQTFSMRYPAIDGQGNFGSIDGDSAAAMRYTEARMTNLSEEILRDIEKDTVDFVPNYDDKETEPDVLPSRVPNLLLNGSSGIAVGMATNIPPHSLDELIDGLLLVLDNKNVTLEEVMQFIKGPDFPTGGLIFGKKGIIEAYRTGRGRVKLRAKTHIEIVLNNLFKSTTMEATFGVIMLAISNKEPKIFSLIELLKLFLNHRKTVIIRRTIFDLEKARARAHILEGLKIALSNIDEVINLIKSSADTTAARDGLVSKFGLTELQANAILDMRLSKLTGLEREKLETELAELMAEIARLDEILKSETLLENLIREELLEIKGKFKVPRITGIVDDYDDIDIEDLIPNENMVVTITHRGYIKRVPSKQYEKQKRGGKGKVAVTTYDDDFIESFFTSNTHDTLMFVTDRGQLYWLKVYKIPEGSRTAKGKAVVNLISLQADEKIMAIIPTTDFDESKSLAFFTKNGIVKRTNLSEFKNIRSIGVRAISLDENDELVTALIVENDESEINIINDENLDESGIEFLNENLNDESLTNENTENSDENNEEKMLFIVTKKGMCLKFKLSKVRQMGRSARGVTGIKFKEQNDEVVGAAFIESNAQEILSISQKGIGKRTTADEYRLTNRGGKGVICMKLTNKTGDLVGVVMVDDNADLMALTTSGKMIRVDMQSIRKAGRNTSGVIVVNVDGDEVASIAKCPKAEEDEDDDNNAMLDIE